MPDTGGAQRHPVDTARLLSWWVTGAGGQQIQWNEPGAFERCQVLAKEVFAKNGVTNINIDGFCSNRGEEATGHRPGSKEYNELHGHHYSGDHGHHG